MMAGKLTTWPQWPEFTLDGAEGGDDLAGFKADIAAEYGEENLRRSWLKVCEKLEEVTRNLEDKGTLAIPEIQFDDLFSLSHERKEEIKDVGCFVVRGVIDEKQVDQWFANLKGYVTDNQDKVTGWPRESPFVLNLYYSPTQMAARSHPNALKVAKELITWWHDKPNAEPLEPLSYFDGVRIRPPGEPFYGLGPHIDAGSLSRWADPTYRACYAPVWAGNPEDLDLYNIGLRKDANQAMFSGSAHSRVFRVFQGWTALTRAGPGEGSLLLYPAVKWSVAYMLLRPFFKAPEDVSQVMDASKWTLDLKTPWFPGTFREDSQLLSPSSHPHLRLKDCLVHIPTMNPGDTVWWHADMCHAVDVDHNGDHDASVAYIAATPSTEPNKSYISSQLEDFLQSRVPEDFRREVMQKSLEPGFKGFTGEAGILSQEGRKAMGFAY